MDQNLRDLMALQQLQATQKLAQAKGKPCPYCGGDAIPNYQRCKNCASPLSWVDGHPCKPGEERMLAQSLAEDRKKKANTPQRSDPWDDYLLFFLFMIVAIPILFIFFGLVNLISKFT